MLFIKKVHVYYGKDYYTGVLFSNMYLNKSLKCTNFLCKRVFYQHFIPSKHHKVSSDTTIQLVASRKSKELSHCSK